MEAAVGFAGAELADNLMATELRLGLPGTAGDDQAPRGKKRSADAVEEAAAAEKESNKRDDGVEAAPPVAKAQVVGWPPVRSYRKSCFQAAAASSRQQSKQAAKEEAMPSNAATPSSTAAALGAAGSFVKVSMDGAPYLRKVDLRMYNGYRELREALEAMFVGSNAGAANLSEFAVTYQDKDGDLMLVGDVPFEMFTSTCKKLRIMKRSEATGLGSPRQ